MGDKKNESSTFTKAFLPRPSWQAMRPDREVPKPDIFDEVQLGNYVSKTDAKIAYQVWSLPDRALGKAWRRHKDRPYPHSTGDPNAQVLVHNIYEHLMSDPLLPVAREDAESKFEADGLEKDWETSGIIEEHRNEIIGESALKDLRSWSSSSIRRLLVARGVSADGDKRALIERAGNTELARYCGIMPQSDLKQWNRKTTGTEGKTQSADNGGLAPRYELQPFENEWMTTLDMYTFAVHLSPYNSAYWTSRAYCHYQQAYFDLALGDAYRAKILCDVLTNDNERSRRPGLYPRVWHAIEQHLLVQPRIDGALKPEIQKLRERGPRYFVNSLLKTLDHIITLSLMALNSWFDLNEQYTSLGSNMLMVQNRDVEVPKILKEIIETVEQDRQEKKKSDKHLFWHERFQGSVSAEKTYPYEPMQVDRTVQDFVDTVDLNIFGNDDYLTKKCQVLAKKVNSLGVFATRDINRGELLHNEEPTIRSHLQPRRMEKDETAVQDERRCENCMRKLDVGAATRFSIYASTKFERCPCFPVGRTAPGPDDRVFCRSAEQSKSKANNNTEKSCLQIASKQHHFGSCGKDWSWLHNSMRPVIRKWQDREYLVQCNDMRGTMHSLLLRNIFEITLHRRKDDPYLSPLEINELLILNANDNREDWFPFSYTGNVTVPFDILTYLGVDIFRDLSFDTWVIQSIMRKLLNYAIPWDEERRGEGPEILPADSFKGPKDPEEQDTMLKAKKSFKDHDPSFMNMYLFPGFSLFRTEVSGNASWGYDTEVPNRILVWAKNDIKEGEEIIIREPWCRNDTNQLCTEILRKEKRKMSATESSTESRHANKKRKTDHPAAENPIVPSGRKRKAPTNDPEAAAQASAKRTRVEVKQFHPQKGAAKIPAEAETKSTKRKRNEYIKSDGITLDFYEIPEDQDPPAGKKRRLALLNKFRPPEDFQHEKWAKELENIEAKRFESGEERRARIQRLKAERLVRYRQEQRERIDERDRRDGRPVRRRNPLCYDFT